MKAREKQREFNVKLMQSLERIENKLDKESGLNKSGSPRRIISINQHHQHSPRNSNKRGHNNSSPSPVMKNKRSREDELGGEMNKIKPPMFDGDHKKDEDVETPLLGMRNYFQLHNYYSPTEGIIAIYQLKGNASVWWDQLLQV
jgi:hypothetical protein